MDDKYTNRLISEDSPYLLQHAHNLVDWYPWSQEAFDLARLEDKPVFLSIGYATCHWCHVMERESFESESVARVLNDSFVSIKLDREQHPDIDDIYMTGVQLLTGQGGWPMSSFLTSDGKPFFAGTYYPLNDFLKLLQQITSLWRTKREEVGKQANEISQAIENYTRARAEVIPLAEDIGLKGVEELLSRHDTVHGGFGGSPKFPNESQLLLMLDAAQRYQHVAALKAAVFSLEKMARGGIYDQVAGGFHRYTVDQNWLTPHFEKMLYNQAQLLDVYCKAFELTGKQEFKQVIEETVDYVLRDMTDPRSGFYSATDADSEGEEGEFFIWTVDQLDTVLGKDLSALACRLYRISSEGNFEGRSILHRDRSWEEYAKAEGITLEELLGKNSEIRHKLYQAREKREHPLRDEKIIVSWNAMMISALVKAGRLVERPGVLETAERVATFLWERCYDPTSGLWRICMNERVSIPANLEDYASLAQACIALYKANSQPQWLERASVLLKQMMEKFRDEQHGGFYSCIAESDTPLITRPKSPLDGAMPSGNSMALKALVEWGQVVQDMGVDAEIKLVVSQMISGYSGLIDASPSAFSYMLIAIQDHLTGSVHSLQIGGAGHVRVYGELTGDSIELHLSLDKGWHIYAGNADDSTETGHSSQLISATVGIEDETVNIQQFSYPEGELWATDFQDQPIRVYRDKALIRLKIDTQRRLLPISFRFQACNQEICLPVEEICMNLIQKR